MTTQLAKISKFENPQFFSNHNFDPKDSNSLFQSQTNFSTNCSVHCSTNSLLHTSPSTSNSVDRIESDSTLSNSFPNSFSNLFPNLLYSFQKSLFQKCQMHAQNKASSVSQGNVSFTPNKSPLNQNKTLMTQNKTQTTQGLQNNKMHGDVHDKVQIPISASESLTFASILSQLFSLDALSHGVAGTIAGNITMAIFYPLDQLRLRSQVEDKSTSEIIKEELKLSKENPLRLYEGLGPLLFSLACSNFVYFYCNNALKLLLKWRGRRLTVPANLIIAALAGCINVLVTNPLWVVNTRVRTQARGEKKKSMIDVFREMTRDEGVKSLWNGTTSSLLLVSNPTIQFVAYDTCKRIWSRYVKRSLYSIEYFLLAAFAKSLATFITYPLQVAQSQIRAQRKAREGDMKRSSEKVTISKVNPIDTANTSLNSTTDAAEKLQTSTENLNTSTSSQISLTEVSKMDTSMDKSKISPGEKRILYRNTLDCLIKLFQREGVVKGWFKGFSVKFSQTVLMAAFHFLAYEKIMSIIYLLLRVKH